MKNIEYLLIYVYIKLKICFIGYFIDGKKFYIIFYNIFICICIGDINWRVIVDIYKNYIYNIEDLCYVIVIC